MMMYTLFESAPQSFTDLSEMVMDKVDALEDESDRRYFDEMIAHILQLSNTVSDGDLLSNAESIQRTLLFATLRSLHILGTDLSETPRYSILLEIMTVVASFTARLFGPDVFEVRVPDTDRSGFHPDPTSHGTTSVIDMVLAFLNARAMEVLLGCGYVCPAVRFDKCREENSQYKHARTHLESLCSVMEKAYGA